MANREIAGTEWKGVLVADLSEATAIKLALQGYLLAQDRQCRKYDVSSPVRVALEAEKQKVQDILNRFGG